MTVVPDASALLAVLLDEPGSAVVVDVVRGQRSASESSQHAVDRGFPADAVTVLLRQVEIDVVSFDLPQAATVADLRGIIKRVGASLGDRAFLYPGMMRRQPACTADRRSAELDLGIDIRLIR